MIGVLGHQHLRDQRFGGDATLDDPGWRWSLNDRTLARTAAVSRPARDQDAEGGWHDIEPLGYILADLVKNAAAAGASLVLDIDDLLDPLQVCGQRTAVGLARPLGRGPACPIGEAQDMLVASMLDLGQRFLDLLQSEVRIL
jgi:hypothetical protein